MDVEVEGDWKPIDSYINDHLYYEGALRHLEVSGRDIGYSIYRLRGPSSCGFDFGGRGFVQLGAVVDDHGTWPDFPGYNGSEQYSGVSRLQLMVYPMLATLSIGISTRSGCRQRKPGCSAS